MPLTDQDAAAQAIASLDSLSDPQLAAHAQVVRLVHHETGIPFVDIHELFSLYDTLYFRDLLVPRVEVSWSTRLTLCAGICELVKDAQGKYSRIRLKLSEPLLKYRPRSDTINTLLHEAIHAYFFVTSSWRHSRDDDDDESGHGTGFQMLASAINTHGNYEVTIYHSFHDEVDSYRTHVWLCNGPCQSRPPYFGLVKRSMNRAPSKSDSWWPGHATECGGIFTKIAEPELTKQQVGALSAKERAGRQKNKIDSWLNPTPGASDASGNKTVSSVGATGSANAMSKLKRSRTDPEDILNFEKKKVSLTCPICDAPVTQQNINDHLDSEHGS